LCFAALEAFRSRKDNEAGEGATRARHPTFGDAELISAHPVTDWNKDHKSGSPHVRKQAF